MMSPFQKVRSSKVSPEKSNKARARIILLSYSDDSDLPDVSLEGSFPKPEGVEVERNPTAFENRGSFPKLEADIEGIGICFVVVVVMVIVVNPEVSLEGAFT